MAQAHLPHGGPGPPPGPRDPAGALLEYAQQIANLLSTSLYIPLFEYDRVYATIGKTDWRSIIELLGRDASLVDPNGRFHGLQAFLELLGQRTSMFRTSQVEGAGVCVVGLNHDPGLLMSGSFRKRVHALFPDRTRLSISTVYTAYRNVWTFEGTVGRFTVQLETEHSKCCTIDPTTERITIASPDNKPSMPPPRAQEVRPTPPPPRAARPPPPSHSPPARPHEEQSRAPSAAPRPLEDRSEITASDARLADFSEQLRKAFAEADCLFVPVDQFYNKLWRRTRYGNFPSSEFCRPGSSLPQDIPKFLEAFAKRTGDFEVFFIASAKKKEGRTGFFGPKPMNSAILDLKDLDKRVHALLPPNTDIFEYALPRLYAKAWKWTDSEAQFNLTMKQVHVDYCCEKDNSRYTIDVSGEPRVERQPLAVPVGSVRDEDDDVVPQRPPARQREGSLESNRSSQRDSRRDGRNGRQRSASRDQSLESDRSRNRERELERSRDRQHRERSASPHRERTSRQPDRSWSRDRRPRSQSRDREQERPPPPPPPRAPPPGPPIYAQVFGDRPPVAPAPVQERDRPPQYRPARRRELSTSLTPAPAPQVVVEPPEPPAPQQRSPIHVTNGLSNGNGIDHAPRRLQLPPDPTFEPPPPKIAVKPSYEMDLGEAPKIVADLGVPFKVVEGTGWNKFLQG